VDYIKVTIRGIRPPIWRRLRVQGSLTFAQLHKVLQAALGWLDYHLCRFSFNDGLEVMCEDPEFPGALHTKRIWLPLQPEDTCSHRIAYGAAPAMIACPPRDVFSVSWRIWPTISRPTGGSCVPRGDCRSCTSLGSAPTQGPLPKEGASSYILFIQSWTPMGTASSLA